MLDRDAPAVKNVNTIAAAVIAGSYIAPSLQHSNIPSITPESHMPAEMQHIRLGLQAQLRNMGRSRILTWILDIPYRILDIDLS